jgi:glycerol kinase
VIETTALGAAYLAGLATGVFTKDEIVNKREKSAVFAPSMKTDVREKLIKGWKKAIKRVMDWEKDDV